MLVKICGITTLADAQAAAAAGADFVGLIRAASPRQVTLDVARAIAERLPPHTRPVLLYRDAPAAAVIAGVTATGINCVQLHGAESVTYIGDLLGRCAGLRLIKAWEVRGPDAADGLSEYLAAARQLNLPLEAVILDTPKGEPHPGFACLGDVARRCRHADIRIFCAGGLTPENVRTALACGPFDGVDVARGVENRPGVKDHAVLRRFVEQAHLA
jgi:phosphoribosylanthranilate isomerase